MNIIKKKTQELEKTKDKAVQIKLLQDINQLFLHKYMLEIDKDLILYPIEVEAYYYNEKNFPDSCVHKYKWQQNRYGKLYFHRAGKNDNASFLFDGGGIDICLSYSNDFYLGVLIRAAWINNDIEPICTPGVLVREVVRRISKDNSLKKITEREAILVRELEEKDDIIKIAINDKRDKKSIVFNSTRFGISPENHPEYAMYKLRSLIELNAPNHPFKAKEKLVVDYIEDKNIEPTLENIKKIIGYNSKSILEKLKSKI